MRDRRRLEDYLAQEQPELALVEANGSLLLRGLFVVKDGAGELDRFEVEIMAAPLATGELPRVRETAGRIPRTAERHMNGKDGGACVSLPEYYFFTHGGDLDLVGFLKDEVRSFFIGQLLIEEGDGWPDEWDHGDAGRRQFFEKVLGTSDPNRVKAYIWVLCHAQPKGHWNCPCGSGFRLRNCCLEQVNALRQRVSPLAAKRISEILEESPLT